jgi:hypothetical protein
MLTELEDMGIDALLRRGSFIFRLKDKAGNVYRLHEVSAPL